MRSHIANRTLFFTVCGLLSIAAGPSAIGAGSVTITNSPNLGVYTIGTVTIPLTATGGTGTYTWSVTGSLPPGLAIRTDIPNLPSGAQAAIAGVATTPGTYSFMLTAASVGSAPASQATTVTITSLVAKDNYQLPDAFSGVSYSYTFTPLGFPIGDTVVFNTPVTGLPAGLSLSSTGTISGSTTSIGAFNFSLSFTDQTTGDTCNRGYQLNVYNVQVTSPGLLPNATENLPYTYTFAASEHSGSGNYTFSGGLPNGLSWNPNIPGQITGTANFSGRYNFNVTATDGSNSYTKLFSLFGLDSSESSPTVNPYGNYLDDCTFGNPCFRGIDNYDGTPPFTWTVSGLPTGMDYTTGPNVPSGNLNPGDVALWGTPLESGTFPVTVTVTDANNRSSTQIFPLHVSLLGLNNGLPNGTLGTVYNSTLIELGGTGGYTAQIGSGALPNGLTLTGQTETVTGTPLESGNFGPIQFTFTDSTLPTANTLTLSLYPYINGPANGTNISINQSNIGSYGLGQSISYQLSACCVAGYTWSAVTTPPSGINLSASGLITGAVSAAGQYSFIAQATNASNSADYGRRLISFAITPIVVTTPYTLPYGNVSGTALYSQPLAATGTSGAVTWSLAPRTYLPPGLSVSSGGVISGYPSEPGQYYFAVNLVDSATPNHNTTTAYFSLEISPVGQAPPVVITNGPNLGTWSIGEIQDQLNATGGNGTYMWSLASGSLPPGLSLRTDFPNYFNSSASAGLIGVATTPGTYTFTLTAASTGAPSASQTFTMKITAFTLKDNYNIPDAFVGHAYSYQMTTLGAPQGSTITFGQCGTNPYNAPLGVTVSSSGLISGTPSAAGTYNNIQFSINDGTDSVCHGLNLLVSAILITTGGPASGALPNATQNAAYSATVSATGGSGAYSWSANGLPNGLSLSTGVSSSATITGTSTGPGKYNFTLTATDTSTNSFSYNEDVSLDTIGVPAVLPRIIQYGNFDGCTYGAPCSRGVGVYSGGTAPFTWNVTGLPTGMSFRTGSGVTADNYSPGDVEIWGVPLQTGAFPVTFTVTDANSQTTTQVYTLNVSNLIVDNGLPNGTLNMAYSSTMRVVGGTPPYKATAGFGALPDGLSFPATAAPTGITVSGTPVENGGFNQQFLITDSGTQSIQFTDYFNIAGAAGTNITVNTTTIGPIALGASLNYTLSACCAAPYIWSLPSTSPNFVNLSASGTVTGTASATGVHHFLVEAQSSTNSSNYGIRLITLTVTPLSISPNSLPYGNVGTAYSQTLSVTGNSGAITWSVSGGGQLQPLPPGFTLTSSGATTALLQGPVGGPTSPGQYFFTVEALDSTTGLYTTQSYTLNIYPVGGVPPVVISNGSNLGTWSIGEIQDQLNATGGNGSYTWTLASGLLPTGLSLRTDFPSYFSSAASAGLIGVATTTGTYTFTLTVASPGAPSASQTFTMKITGFTVKDTYNTPAGFAGQAFSYQMSTLGASVGSTVTWGQCGTNSLNLPPGLTLSPSGLISGTIGANAVNFYNVEFSISDGTDSVCRSISIDVGAIQISSLGPAPGYLPNATQNAPYSTTVSATGGSGTYTWTTNGLPSGLSISTAVAASATISGTDTQGPGMYNFTLTATDANNVSFVKDMAIDTIGVPPALMEVYDGNYSGCTYGVPCSLGLFALNGGTAPFTWNVTGLPTGMSFRSGSGVAGYNYFPGELEIWGVPLQIGSFPITVTATDANSSSVSQAFTLQVGVIVLDNGFVNGTINTAYTSTARLVGGTPPYSATIVTGTGSISGYPDGLSLSSAANGSGLTLSGTPIENGGFSVQLIVTDSGSHSQPFSGGVTIAGAAGTTITVNTTNLGTYTLGSSLNYTLSACCVPSYTWSFPSTFPSFLSLSSSGVITGSTAATGVYQFLVKAADQSNSSNYGIRLITLTVIPADLSINPTSLPYGNVGTAYSQTLSLAGTTGTDTITWSLAPFGFLPPGFTLTSTGATTALLQGPTGGPTSPGQYDFTVDAFDPVTGFTTPRGYTLNIYAAGIVPPLDLTTGPNLGTYSVGPFLGTQLTPTGGQPPYTYSYTPGAAPIPGVRVQTGGPFPTGFAATTTGGLLGIIVSPGTYPTSIRVTDSLGNIFDRAVYVTVLPITILSTGTLPKATVNTAYSFQFTGFGGSGNYLFSSTNLPAGLTISAGGLLTGTPTATGTFSPTIVIEDLNNATSVGFTYTLTVNAFSITNNAVLTQGTVGSAYSTTLTASNATCGSSCAWTVSSGSLPGGLSLNSSTGAITGTPTGTSNGSPTIQAVGSAGTVTKLFSLQVVAATPEPLFINTTSPLGNVTIGGQVNTQLTVQGGTPPYHWSVTAGSLPPGISLNGPGETLGANDGPGFTFLWGRAQQAGTYTFTLTTTDSAPTPNTISQQFTWEIQVIGLSYASLPIAGNPLVYNQSYSQALLALGGSGSYAFSAPAMPPGMSLTSGGVVTGTPSNTGSFSDPVAITDTSTPVNTAAQNVSFNIADSTGTLVTINTGPNLGTYAEGFSDVFNLNPTGGTAPYTLTALSALPPGCALETLSAGTELSNANGNYDMVCQPLAAGTYAFTVQATDSAATPNIGVKTLTMTVVPFTLFTSTALANGSVGTPYTETLLAWDNSAAVTWSQGPGTVLPPGLQLNGNVISGTPTVAGNNTFTLLASDGSGSTITYTFTLLVSSLTITNPPDQQAPAQALPVQATVNQPFSFTFTATGGSPLTWSATNLPSGLTIGAATGTISGTPTSIGTFRVPVTVTSGASSLTRIYTLFVITAPPIFNFAESLTNLPDAFVGQSYSDNLVPSGGAPPYSWAVASGSALPPGMSLITGANLPPSYAADVTIIAGSPSAVGRYSFTLISTDSNGAQLTRPFMLNVSPMGILAGSLKTGNEGVAYSEQLTAVGGTPPYAFTYTAAGINTPLFPTGITASASGLISGTPTSTGNYSFYVTVTDSAQPANTYTTSYTLTVVNGANNLEITTAVPFDLSAGKAYHNGTLLESVSGGVANATYTYSITAGALPTGLSLDTSDFGAGFTGMVGPPETPGPYSYTLHASDGNGNTADRTYNGVVMPVNQSLFTINLPVGVAGESYNNGNGYQLAYIGNTNASGLTFVESPLYPLPPGMALSSTGLLSGTPTVTGAFLVYFSLKDNATGLTSNTGGFTLYVTPQGTSVPLTVTNAPNPTQPSMGVPSNVELNQFVATGTPPYTWAVAQGSSLPAGVSIVPGTGGIYGVSAYLAGTATVPIGDINLVVTDASGQTADFFNSGVPFSALSLTPNLNSGGFTGVVGQPFNQTITIAGGTPPYFPSLGTTSDGLPGVSLSFSGNTLTLTGTPTYPGSFQGAITITDSAATPNTLNAFANVTIDAAAGGAPGLSISPAATTINYVLTSASPTEIPIVIGATSGSVGFSAMVSGIPGATLSQPGGIAPTTLYLNLNTPPTSPGTWAGVVAIQWQGSGFGYSAIPVTLNVTSPPPCTYSANPATGSVNADGSGATPFGIVTGPLCSWTVSDPDPWVTITSAASGTGPANITFTAAANSDPTERTSSISINNGAAVYSITQFGSSCSFTISPSSFTLAPAAGTSIPVSVTASSQACSWSASAGLGAPAVSPASGTGNGTVTVTIPANASANTASYSASIAQLNFTASQVGVNCVASFSLPSAEIGAAGTSGANSFSVAAPSGCSYVTSNAPSWITVTAGVTGTGPGPNTFSYTVAANPATVARSANLTIGGTQFTVNQDALACSVTLDTSPLTLPFAAAGDAGSINVIANGSNCSWAASTSSTASWATISPPNGTGSGTVNVTVASNASSAAARTGSITVAGTNVNIAQAGTNCTGQYSLASLTGGVPAGGGSGSVGVMAPGACTWTASSQAPSWLTITSSGTAGNSFVQFTAAPNTSATPLVGTLTIAGITYTVTEAGAPCSYTLPSSATTIAAAGTSASFAFTTAVGCTNTALSYSGWITGVTTNYNGPGTGGTVNYTVAQNPAGTNRTGAIQIGNQTYTVTETAAACAFSLNSYGAAFGQAGGSGSVFGSPNAQGCSPSAGTTQPAFITNIGTPTGPIADIFTEPFTVLPFNSAVTAIRIGYITFGGLTFVVKQTSW